MPCQNSDVTDANEAATENECNVESGAKSGAKSSKKRVFSRHTKRPGKEKGNVKNGLDDKDPYKTEGIPANVTEQRHVKDTISGRTIEAARIRALHPALQPPLSPWRCCWSPM